MPYYPPAAAGVSEHGDLTGLADDDHTQYQKETDFTEGSVLFRGATAIAQDNASLFWDDTNNRLGIRTNPTLAHLQISNTADATSTGISLGIYHHNSVYGTTNQFARFLYSASVITDFYTADDNAFTIKNTSGAHNIVIDAPSAALKLQPSGGTMAFGATAYRFGDAAAAQSFLQLVRAAAPASITTPNHYLMLGGPEYGTDSYRTIGFGWIYSVTTHAPAYMGYQETASTGNTYGDLIFGTRPGDTDVAPTERLRIAASGNVGIRTGINPSQPLSVVGNTLVTSGAVGVGANSVAYFSSYDFIAAYQGSIAVGHAASDVIGQFAGGGNDLYFDQRAGAAGKIYFRTYSNQIRMTIDGTNSGNVGIGATSPTSVLQVSGPVATAITTKTTTYTVTATDSIILGNHATVAFTITLPTAVGCAGRKYTFKNINAAAVTVDGDGSETIDGATTYVLGTQWKYVVVVSDGANWVIVGNN